MVKVVILTILLQIFVKCSHSFTGKSTIYSTINPTENEKLHSSVDMIKFKDLLFNIFNMFGLNISINTFKVSNRYLSIESFSNLDLYQSKIVLVNNLTIIGPIDLSVHRAEEGVAQYTLSHIINEPTLLPYETIRSFLKITLSNVQSFNRDQSSPHSSPAKSKPWKNILEQFSRKYFNCSPIYETFPYESGFVSVVALLVNDSIVNAISDCQPSKKLSQQMASYKIIEKFMRNGSEIRGTFADFFKYVLRDDNMRNNMTLDYSEIENRLHESQSSSEDVNNGKLKNESYQDSSDLKSHDNWKGKLYELVQMRRANLGNLQFNTTTHYISGKHAGYICRATCTFRDEILETTSDNHKSKRGSVHDASRRMIELLIQKDSTLQNSIGNDKMADYLRQLYDTNNSIVQPHLKANNENFSKGLIVELNRNWKGQLYELIHISNGLISNSKFTTTAHNVDGKSVGFISSLRITINETIHSFVSDVYPNKKYCEHDVGKRAIDYVKKFIEMS